MHKPPPCTNGSAPGVAGFTLIETSIATALAAGFVAMLMLMSSNVLGLLRTAKDDISASQALQERVEQMRIANWLQITDATHISKNLLAADTGSVAGLDRAVETLTVSAYPAKTGSTNVKVTRQNNITTIVSSNALLKDERMVRVDLEINWEGFPKKRKRMRATTALIAKGGITK